MLKYQFKFGQLSTMRELTISLFFLSIPSCLNALSLEKRVDALEKQLGGLESLVSKILEQELVDRYGLIRRCPLPEVEHGKVDCDKEDRIPGTHCKAHCAPGYIATPGVTCQKGGQTWSGQLRCDKELPLLVVSGGSDSPSVEVIDFHNGTGCDLKIPDIPKSKHGEVRLMHNMFYFPGSPFQLFVCNGLSQSSKASCDSWTLGDDKWKHHSYPNVDERQHDNDIYKDSSYGSNLFKEDVYHLGRSGRYAASTFSWDGEHYIVGGMLNEGNDHQTTNGIRRYKGKNIFKSYMTELIWKKPYDSPKMKTKRALFCIAQHNITNFVAIGGHSGKIEKSVETIKGSIKIPDMETARNGHSCVGIDGDASKILVSGGSDSTHRSGAKALKTSEMYSSETSNWEKVGDMTYTRFGHALVNIGGRIIALGGKEWNPDVPLKNAEEFDAATKTWTNIGDVMSVPRANFGYALIPHSVIPGCTIH